MSTGEKVRALFERFSGQTIPLPEYSEEQGALFTLKLLDKDPIHYEAVIVPEDRTDLSAKPISALFNKRTGNFSDSCACPDFIEPQWRDGKRLPEHCVFTVKEESHMFSPIRDKVTAQIEAVQNSLVLEK